jgi:ABC-type phosphate transport system substrate-binding protein
VKHFIQAILLGFAMCAVVTVPSAAHAEVVLVGSSKLHFSEISKTKLRDLYTGQSQMVGNASVLVIDRDDAFRERSHFILSTLGFTSEEFKTVQRLLECIGVSKAPTVARDSKHMIQMLVNNPNALGYVTQSELQDNGVKSKLRLIKVLAE